MPNTPVIATRDFLPLFMKGDTATIVPVLYEEDTQVGGEVRGVFRVDTGELVRIWEQRFAGHEFAGCEIRTIHPAVIAPKGSYKSSFIRLSDGREYPGTLVRHYDTYFEKIKV